MKQMLSILAFALLGACSLSAQDQLRPDQSEEIRTIFQKNFVNADDYSFMLNYCAEKVIQEKNYTMQPGDLVESFTKAATIPEIEQRFLELYEKEFNEQEIKDIYELIHNEKYMKYRGLIQNANFKCYEEALKLFDELAETYVEKKPSKPAYEIIQVTNSNLQSLLKSSRPVIIDVYTDWCGPCKFFSSSFKEANEEYGNLYQFAKLNYDHAQSAGDSLKITGFPTVIYFKDGKEVGRHLGYMSKAQFVAEIKKYFQ
jgi:thioredoxin 1